MKVCQVEHNKIIMEEDIQSKLFDGRKDIKTIVFGEDGKLHPVKIKENHNSVFSKPCGSLLHFVNNPDERGESQLINILVINCING